MLTARHVIHAYLASSLFKNHTKHKEPCEQKSGRTQMKPESCTCMRWYLCCC
jgi:hypothetical protein